MFFFFLARPDLMFSHYFHIAEIWIVTSPFLFCLHLIFKPLFYIPSGKDKHHMISIGWLRVVHESGKKREIEAFKANAARWQLAKQRLLLQYTVLCKVTYHRA